MKYVNTMDSNITQILIALLTAVSHPTFVTAMTCIPDKEEELEGLRYLYFDNETIQDVISYFSPMIQPKIATIIVSGDKRATSIKNKLTSWILKDDEAKAFAGSIARIIKFRRSEKVAVYSLHGIVFEVSIRYAESFENLVHGKGRELYSSKKETDLLETVKILLMQKEMAKVR